MSGLVAHWKFNGNLNDSSGNSKTLTMNSGSATYSGGIYGQAINTTSNYPYCSSISIGKNATITCWSRIPSGNPANKMMWAIACTAYPNNGMNLYKTAGTYCLNIGDGSVNQFVREEGGVVPEVADNDWHHFAVVFKESSNAELFIDGSYVGTALTYRDNTMSNQRMDIGSWHADANYLWPGYIDDVRVYNRSLSDVEIREVILSENDLITIATSDSYKGVLVPKKPNNSHQTLSDSAPVAKGYTDNTGSTVKDATLVSNNGSQTWTSANTFNRSSASCTGLNEEGFVKDATVVVTNITTDAPAGVGVSKNVYADKVFNAVWNDIADRIEVPDDTKLEYGKCYCFDGNKYYQSTRYLDDGIIGIHSDTAGIYMGDKPDKLQLSIAVAGFVLAYVDRAYKPGTPLTCGENGYLTELKEEDMIVHPEKLVATYWKREKEDFWGFDQGLSENLFITVNNRRWVKVK